VKQLLRPLVALGASLTLLGLAGCGVSSHLNGDHVGTLQAKGQTETRKQVRLTFRAPSQLKDMGAHGVDLFENVDMAKGTVDALVTPKGEAYLKRLGIRYTVTMTAAQIGVKGFPRGYHTLASLTSELQAVAAAHPDIVHLQTIGHSLENRPITAVEITSHPGAGLPSVMINSGQHARELPPVELTTRLIHLLAESYGKDSNITKLVDGRDIWIVPVVNPDGRTRVEQNDSMWRKNVRDNGDGTMGVDTNRNADDHFSEGDRDGGADDFGGASPFSEPEAQAMRDLCLQHHFAVSLDIHNYSGMVLWPPGYDNSTTKDDAAFHKIGDHMAQHIGYKAGTIARTIYNTYGDLATWEYDALGTLAFAAELDDPNFNPPFSQVDSDWKAWKDNLVYLISVSDNPRGQ
jgi:hypothetical protein